MSLQSLTAAERRRSLAAAIGSTSTVGLTMGLTWPLLSLILEEQGTDSRLIGLSAATQSLAIAAFSPFAPKLMVRFGLYRSIMASVGVAMVMLLLLALLRDIYAWFPIRFLLGAAATIVFIAGETWVVQLATDRTRGRVVGLLGLVWSIAFGAGPLILSVIGTEGWLPFVIGVVALALSALPLAFAGGLAPDWGSGGGLRIRSVLGIIPATLLAGAALAVFDNVNDSFVPIYVLRNGHEQTLALWALASLHLGILTAQLPIGWVMDHYGRWPVLLGVIGTMLVASLLWPFTVGDVALLFPIMFVMGASSGSLWTVSLVLVGDRFSGRDLAVANTARGVIYGLGSVCGPAIAGSALWAWDPHGVPLVYAGTCLAFLAVAAATRCDRVRASDGLGAG